MPELLMLRGVPGCGKTTYAKHVMPKHKRVNKDDLRAMIDNGEYTEENEKLIKHLQKVIICEMLDAGHDVIVDDTNLPERYEDHYRELVVDYNEYVGGMECMRTTFRVQEINTPLEECIKRDLKRPNSIGPERITQMHQEYSI